MHARTWSTLPAVVGALFMLAGCAATPRHAAIPLGKWHGEGTFASVGLPKGETAETGHAQLLEHGTYPTDLNITPATDLGDGAVRLEIVSLRSGYETLEGDRTHLIVFLAPVPAEGEGTVTPYRIVKSGMAFKDEEPSLDEGPENQLEAVCMLADGEPVLHVQYADQFIDNFRFRGNQVYKQGSFCPEKGEQGFIFWSEALRPVR